MRETRENLEIDLKRIAVVLLGNAWIILVVGALLAAMAFGYAWFFISPTYSASVQLYVNNNYPDSPGYSSSQLTAAQYLANTYMVMVKSRNVLNDVAEVTGLGYSYPQLRGMISASAVNETEIFQITVTCGNYQHATVIANAIADVLPDKLTAIVDASSVRVVDYAVENPVPVGPVYMNYALIGALLGCGLTALIVIIMELMDTTINSEEYLAHVYKEYPLLAVVPGAESSKPGYKGYYKGSYESAQKQKPAKRSGGDRK